MTTHSESPLVAKIRKLMAKANDAGVTEAEAAAFAAKVQELLVANGLAMSDIGNAGAERDAVGENEYDFKRWNSPSRRMLLVAVCRFYMCDVLYFTRSKMIKLIGRPHNVMVAVDMTDYLVKTVVRISNQWGRSHPDMNVIDFRKGCMMRLAERLYALKREQQEAQKPVYTGTNPGNLPALFESEAKMVQAYMSEKYRPRATKGRTIRAGAVAASAGRAAADGISLHRQVGEAKGSRLQIGRK